MALAVAMFILPARAHVVLGSASGEALTLMADLMDVFARQISGAPKPGRALALHARIRRAITEAEAAADEAVRERRAYLASGFDPQPLCRTLRRMRSDLSMIGRAASAREAGSACAELDRATLEVASAVSAFLRACAQAIHDGAGAPSLSRVDDRVRAQAGALAEVRRSDATRDLAGDVVNRIFGLAFSFQQLHRNLQDLADRVDELAKLPASPAGARTGSPPPYRHDRPPSRTGRAFQD